MTFTQLLQHAQRQGFRFIEEEGFYPMTLEEFLEAQDGEELDQDNKVLVHNLTSNPAMFVVQRQGKFTERVLFTLTK